MAMAVNKASEPEKEKPIYQWVFSLLMVVLVLAIAFKNPKRSHQT